MDFRSDFKIEKRDDDKHLVFGWAAILKEGGEDVVDYHGELIPMEIIEKAAYDFNLNSRTADVMHDFKDVAQLIESVVITKEKATAMGISVEGQREGWWVGWHVTDEDVWKKIQSGELSMFSIGGTGIREAV